MTAWCFGIDLGGTSVKCALFQTDGTVEEKWEIKTRVENEGKEILPDIAKFPDRWMNTGRSPVQSTFTGEERTSKKSWQS